MKQKSEKRIVSKAEYITKKTSRTLAMLIGCGFGFVAVIWTLACGMCLVGFMPKDWDPGGVIGCLLSGVFFGILAIGMYFSSFCLIKDARTVDPGVPLTRANMGDLPAVDSLVRASSESLHAQQIVLLRPAMETTETQEELLRAASGELGC